MNALDLAAANARLARITADRRAEVLADPIEAAVQCWTGNLDWYSVDDACVERVGDVLEARISYGPDDVYRHPISLANLPADPFARHEEVWHRLDDFAAGVDDLIATCPDHSPDDLARTIRAARARRLVDRTMRHQDPAALIELLGVLGEARKS